MVADYNNNENENKQCLFIRLPVTCGFVAITGIMFKVG
jgi:hypothetical protein